MSGQMSNGEIEGVLASIRRLLRDDATEDAPGARDPSADDAAADWPGTGKPTARPARKLVLNPDAMIRPDSGTGELRPDSAGEAPLVLTDPASVPVPDEGMPAGPDLTDDPAIAAWSAPLLLSDPVVLPRTGRHGDGLSDDGETGVRPGVPLRPDARLPAGTGAQDDRTDPAPDPVPEVLWRPTTRTVATTRRPPSLEERIAELEAALARDEATWEPDGGDPAPGTVADGPADSAPEAGTDARAAGTGPAARDGGALQPRLGPAEVRAWIAAESLKAFGSLPDDIAGDMAGEIARGIPEDISEEIPEEGGAALSWVAADAGVPAEADHGQPDRAAADHDASDDRPVTAAVAPEPLPQEPPVDAGGDPVAPGAAIPDSATADVPAPDLLPASAVARDSAAAKGEAAPSDADHGLDPAMAAAVRALVAETIRAELRGPLGEDLTRAIRRLVRREWAHRLSADE